MPADNGGPTILELREANAVMGTLGLPLPRFIPRRYKPRNIGSWSGHLAFASDLIAATQPGLIVELGTHWGEAYFTFCQIVEERGLNSLCYAVDHWLGDEHAGHYGEEVFEDVRQYNERYYSQFSYLLRSSFDGAVSQFGDASIELLHIDGLHTYEAASHDFHTWLPKVKPGGIVLLHDICPKHEDFGVWRLWDEIKAELPNTFEFHHSWGLGVVRKPGGASTSPLLQFLFSDSTPVREEIRRRYVIYASHLEHLLSNSPDVTREAVVVPDSDDVYVQVFPFGATGYSEDTSLLKKGKSGTWNTLTFELPEDLGREPLRIDPGHAPSLVEVSDIEIGSRLSGDVLWKVNASSNSGSLTASGTSTLHPVGNALLLVSFGDDPQLLLTMPSDLREPLQLSISLRVSPAPNPAPQIVEELIKAEQTLAEHRKSEATAARLECDRIAAQLSQVAAEEQSTQQRLHAAEDKLLSEQAIRMAMQQSLSWKMTEPIRKLLAIARSEPREQR